MVTQLAGVTAMSLDGNAKGDITMSLDGNIKGDITMKCCKILGAIFLSLFLASPAIGAIVDMDDQAQYGGSASEADLLPAYIQAVSGGRSITVLNLMGVLESAMTGFEIHEDNLPSGSGMVYPGAGIALSTGSAWGGSIANNSGDWNTAFGWGDHGAVGYLATLTGHGVAELDDVSDAGSGIIVSGTERTKLNGVAAGAEVNVQSDWNAGSGDAHILNKPTLGTASTRNAEDTMTNGSNLPDGAAIIVYGDANWSGGGGTVDTSGTPALNDFAKFTDANTVEGRSYTETRADLGLVVGTNVQAHDADLDDLSDGSLTGTKVGFSDTNNDWSGTNVDAALIEMVTSINGGVPNSATAKVHWSQIAGMPDCFSDGADATGAGGSAIVFDIGDDGGNDSTDVNEIATSGDTNSIFTEPSADKILIDLSNNWPTADTANAGDSATGFFSVGEIVDARISNTLTASLFVGSGSTTSAIDLATAEVAGTLPAANIHADIARDSELIGGSWASPGVAIGTGTPVEATFVSVATSATADPGFDMKDSNCPGTDKDIGGVYGQYVDGVDGAENADLLLRTYQGGVSTTQFWFDESQNGWIIPSGKYLFFGTTGLHETTSATDSGAYLIGIFDEFANSNSATVQAVLNDLDNAIAVSASTTVEGKAELATTTEVNTGTDTVRTITPHALATSNLGTKDICINIVDSDTAVAIANGVIAYTVPTFMSTMELTNVVCSVHTQGVTGTTDVQVRRRRAGTDVNMLSTQITLSAEYYVSDEVINTSNDDINIGDQLYIDVSAIHSGTAPNGLSCVLEFITEGN